MISLKRANKLTPSFHLKSAKAASAKANPTEVVTAASKKIVLYWNHADGAIYSYHYKLSYDTFVMCLCTTATAVATAFKIRRA